MITGPVCIWILKQYNPKDAQADVPGRSAGTMPSARRCWQLRHNGIGLSVRVEPPREQPKNTNHDRCLTFEESLAYSIAGSPP